jgi:hypothetical protein
VTGKGVRTTASLDMVVRRAERSVRAFTLRRILLELLQNADGPMTIAAIWDHVRERCGESSAVSLAEIDTLLNYLSNYAYPFERVGKNSWKWGVGHPAAARPLGSLKPPVCTENFIHIDQPKDSPNVSRKQRLSVSRPCGLE